MHNWLLLLLLNLIEVFGINWELYGQLSADQLINLSAVNQLLCALQLICWSADIHGPGFWAREEKCGLRERLTNYLVRLNCQLQGAALSAFTDLSQSRPASLNLFFFGPFHIWFFSLLYLHVVVSFCDNIGELYKCRPYCKISCIAFIMILNLKKSRVFFHVYIYLIEFYLVVQHQNLFLLNTILRCYYSEPLDSGTTWGVAVVWNNKFNQNGLSHVLK